MGLVKHICPDWHGCHNPPYSKIVVFSNQSTWTDRETIDTSICPKCLEISLDQIAKLPTKYFIRTYE